MTCPSPDALQQLGQPGLDPEARGRLLDHAAGCTTCRAAVEAVLAVTVGTQAGPDRPPAPGPTTLAPATTQLGRYQLGRVLGRGAMGVVYAAHDPELDREVAIKLLRGAASADRLRREAQALARLVDPHVVRVYDVGEADGRVFVAMELVEGMNLRQWLASARSVPERVAVLRAAGRGLVAAHQAGLIHRDFKPDNVLIADDGRVLVTDFGLARSADPPPSQDGPAPSTAAPSSEVLTATGALVGTPAYMAPEQIDGQPAPASDQYAFAVTAWEALFGQRPFQGGTLAELAAATRRAAPRRPGEVEVPPRVEAALVRGLSADPAARFPSVAALLDALAPIEAPTQSRRWPWLAGGAVAVVAVVLGWRLAVPRSRAADCAAAARLAPTWTDAVEAGLRSRHGDSAAAGMARYARQWQTARRSACEAPVASAASNGAGPDPRLRCLDLARSRFGTVVAVLADANAVLLRPVEAIDSLLPLERCLPGAPTAIAPTATQAGAVSDLDAELTRLEVSLLAGRPGRDVAATAALRVRAEATGYAPLVLRALLIEARVAIWSGERAVAERTLRGLLVRAEQAGDDLTRIQAHALLAVLLAGERLPEATTLSQTARATLDRVGGDPTIERLVIEAEIEVLTRAGDHRGAARLQADLVAALELSLAAPEVRSAAYTRLSELWWRAGDEAARSAAIRAAMELTRKVGQAEGVTDPGLLEAGPDPTDALMAGDFEGAVRSGRAQLALLAAVPADERPGPYYSTVAYITSDLAMSFDLDGRFTEALEAYRDGEAAWSLPMERFTAGDTTADLVAITSGRIDNLIGQAACLLELGRASEAVEALRRVPVLPPGADPKNRADAARAARWLGIGLVAVGQPAAAITLLAPTLASTVSDPASKPMVRARHRFALAQALWEAGSLDDRPRALAMAADAEHDLTLAIADAAQQPALRQLPPLARALGEKIAAWRAAHVVRPAAPPR
ncbi:MAG: serine/threonine protein kinase [Kofleriaceae bacterium]|nr:serine/threonine protein kinase [Kofleriaceae bacterium]MBP6837130.1 serine/threonine protein kinase [Kofleriaceae bacterium]MBP9207866.1 serine/threonine protein kinase [Kofleriaceae bacterium]